MITKTVLICAVVAVSQGVAISVIDGSFGYGLTGHGLYGTGNLIGGHAIAVAKHVDLNTPAHYEFKYGVQDQHTGDNKQQSEVRVGDTVKGEYSLAEPDGTIRIVKYTADPHNGFNAVVSRVGHAAHPQGIHKAVITAPIIHHPIGYNLGLGLH